ncbi:MAG: hypothetical protein DRG78_17325 [Epsilonproteobacteria bacterium]|nr:MAG: hypothetical protein DRG78_17325 [Campylobacterota bacterium]
MEDKPEIDIEHLDIQDKLENDFDFFVSFVHIRLENQEFIWSPYNRKLAKEFVNVYNQKYLVLLINIPPRLGKTILLTYFFAWTQYKLSKRAYNNYYTYADILVEKLYSTMEKIFKIPEIAERVDTTFKKRKEDFSNTSASGIYATTILGKTTGMGAGKKEDEDTFSGAIGIDDSNKASDSVVRLASTNRAVKSAILNRKNNAKVPIIIIAQRLHKLDLSGYILDLYEDWFKDGRAKHIKMPVLRDGRSISLREYPLELIELERKKDEAYFYCQLQQEPLSITGKYFKDSIFNIVEDIPKEKSITILYFNPESAIEPIVFLAVKKAGADMVIVDYFEDKIEPSSFFSSLIDFSILNNSKKVYIPKSLVNKTVIQKLKPLKVEEVEDLPNVELSAFYSVGLLEEGKIILKDNENSIPLKEELKLFPQTERNYVVKAVVTALEILFIKGGGRISSSL